MTLATQAIWESYQPLILVASLVVAALSLLVLFLLGLLRKYNHTRQALANLNADLETQVLERTADLSLSNERLEHEIAERRQVEVTMRQLSRAVEQSWSTIVITDLNGNIVFVNPAFERITGYSREQAIGQNPRVLKSGHTPAETYAELWQTISSGGVWQGELLNRKKNGELYWENAIISPVRNAQGQTTHYVAIKEDITARKQAEETLRQYTRQLEELQIQLSEQAIRDPLSGAYNRRFLLETLERELARSLRGQYAVSLLMLDVDRFKEINDTYGHPAGDQALKSMVNVIGCLIRKSDVLCRYGGDEFVILLPQTTHPDALRRAEEWRRAVQDMAVNASDQSFSITVSIGVASTGKARLTCDELLAQADQSLYSAKQATRNCVRG